MRPAPAGRDTAVAQLSLCPPVTAPRETPIREAAARMRKEGVSSLVEAEAAGVRD